MKVPNSQKMEGRIALLASYPKSGSTWTRLFLSAASLVKEGGSEFNLNRRPYAVPFASDRKLILDETGLDTSELTLEESAMAQRWALQELSFYAAFKGRRTGLKTHDRWLVGQDSKPVFDSTNCAAIVLLVRNPLDIAGSLAHHLGISIDGAIEQLCDPEFCMTPGLDEQVHTQIPYIQGTWGSHTASWLHAPLPQRIVVRYEDLLGDPEKWFSKIAICFGIELTQQECKQAIEHTGFSKLQDLEAKDGFIERPVKLNQFFRKGRLDGWRTELNDRQVRKIIDNFSDIMSELGYEIPN